MSDTRTLTVGEAVVDGLVRNGIETIFCLPGIQNDLFFDALHTRTDEIRPIHTRHEQAVAYMALGAAQASGKPSAFCVVPGPGFLNVPQRPSPRRTAQAPLFWRSSDKSHYPQLTEVMDCYMKFAIR